MNKKLGRSLSNPIIYSYYPILPKIAKFRYTNYNEFLNHLFIETKSKKDVKS